MTESSVENLSSAAIRVGETIIVRMTADYVTAMSHESGKVDVSVNMSEDQMRALYGGLQAAVEAIDG